MPTASERLAAIRAQYFSDEVETEIVPVESARQRLDRIKAEMQASSAPPPQSPQELPPQSAPPIDAEEPEPDAVSDLAGRLVGNPFLRPGIPGVGGDPIGRTLDEAMRVSKNLLTFLPKNVYSLSRDVFGRGEKLQEKAGEIVENPGALVNSASSKLAIAQEVAQNTPEIASALVDAAPRLVSSQWDRLKRVPPLVGRALQFAANVGTGAGVAAPILNEHSIGDREIAQSIVTGIIEGSGRDVVSALGDESFPLEHPYQAAMTAVDVGTTLAGGVGLVRRGLTRGGAKAVSVLDEVATVAAAEPATAINAMDAASGTADEIQDAIELVSRVDSQPAVPAYADFAPEKPGLRSDAVRARLRAAREAAEKTEADIARKAEPESRALVEETVEKQKVVEASPNIQAATPSDFPVTLKHPISPREVLASTRVEQKFTFHSHQPGAKGKPGFDYYTPSVDDAANGLKAGRPVSAKRIAELGYEVPTNTGDDLAASLQATVDTLKAGETAGGIKPKGGESGMAQLEVLGRMAGSGFGGLVGLGMATAEDDSSDTERVLKVIAGMLGGFAFGGKSLNLGDNFSTLVEPHLGINGRRIYQHWFREAGSLHDVPDIADWKRAMRYRHQGRQQALTALAPQLTKIKPHEREYVVSYLMGGVGPQSMSPEARNVAAQLKQISDAWNNDIQLAAVKAGLGQSKIVDSLGVYGTETMLSPSIAKEWTKVASYARARGMKPGQLMDRNWWKQGSSFFNAEERAAVEALHKRIGTRSGISDFVRIMETTSSNIMRMELIDRIRAGTGLTMSESDVMAAFAGTGKWKPLGGADSARFQRGEQIFRQLPNNKTRYGDLAGKFVDERIGHDLEAWTKWTDPNHWFSKFVIRPGNAIMSGFKFGKIGLSPATNIRNAIGQAMLNDIVGGVRFYTPDGIKTTASGVRSYLKKDQWYQRAAKAGQFGAEYYGSELTPVLDSLDRGMDWLEATSLHGISLAKPTKVVKAGGRIAGSAASFGRATDQANKMVLFRHAVEKLGMTDEAAVKWVSGIAFDYEDVPRWIRVLRNSPFGAPFVTFSYKSQPLALRAAMDVTDPKRMLHFWKYPMLLSAWNEYAAEASGVRGENKQRRDYLSRGLRMGLEAVGLGFGMKNLGADAAHTKFLSSWAGPQQLLLTTRDEFGQAQHIDLTGFTPFGTPFAPLEVLKTPHVQMFFGGVSGIDPSTGKKIVRPQASVWDRAADTFSFIGRTFGPASIVPAGAVAADLATLDIRTKRQSPYQSTTGRDALGATGLGIKGTSIPRAKGLRAKGWERELDALDDEERRALRNGEDTSNIRQRRKRLRAHISKVVSREGR